MKQRPIPSINLARLIREGGSTSAKDEIWDYIALPNERIPLVGPAVWRVSVTKMEGEGGVDFWLSGEIAGNALMECRRCLTPTPAAVRAHFQYLLRYQSGLAHLEAIEENEEEILLFGHPDLDLEPLLSEAFALELPYTVLCKEDCKGLCPVCGANLNEVDCGHQAKTHSRLEAELSKLLDGLKD
ncbi:YceD family protein [Meiothermus ruber]|jgi:uncharacterized protein|uniref:DUF177 domain-containing protein n=1 Tax=Meiothermus ruber (strain ATCC 35948 / DSM 1279 / VKM B-1258 / 21) TaxID=504728 RepID=D3PPY8_MEIRD|nr:DUF177 domain-containing protein [Meiothermus ruber]GIW39378.1 MAG: hypothetical protein KatS3mg075_859 [Meiothermus sp.]ADD27614.1 protein of unknown function DUF177 [Meiothermus ruber DSM 1279]AGK04079.1 hypothetical protein K649_03885 [Meiothermus ruber DSM 1279]MCL6531129.1 DUF177 domain-containing protein [Meiothermus ruber]MCX7801739.1 DUF177 domain-containing protein [Meiothermus ruber]